MDRNRHSGSCRVFTLHCLFLDSMGSGAVFKNDYVYYFCTLQHRILPKSLFDSFLVEGTMHMYLEGIVRNMEVNVGTRRYSSAI